MPEEQNNQQPVQNDRTKRVEDFLLDPDKVMFETLEEFQTAIQGLTDMLAGVNIAELERLQGEDGVTPERGVNYFNDADLDAIEEFILEQVPRVGFEVPSPEQVQDYIKNAVAKVPRIKGDKGNPGTDGEPGRNGSPDTGTDIVKKLRKLDKNQRLKMSDIRGLENTLRSHREGLEEVEELKRLVEGIRVAIPSMENIQAIANWGDITGDITNQTDLQAILDTKLEDAPSDGKTYGRKDGTWEEVTGGGGGGGTWGSITGTLSDQTDLQNALNAKYDASNPSGFISNLSTFDTDDLAEGSTNKYNVTHTGDATGATSLTVVALRGVALDSTVGSPTDGKILVYRSAGSDWVLEDKPTSTGNPAWGDITGTLASQTDLQAALDDKFDEPTGTTGQYIRGDGSLATFPTIPSGTVTSVGLSVPTGLSVANSPVTTSGTLAITLASGYVIPLQTTLDGKVTNPMTTAGDIIYGGASGAPTRLANGSAGQVLTSAGGTSAPTWETPSATFNLTVEEVGETPVANVDHIKFDGATVTDDGSGEVTVEIEGVAGDAITDLDALTTPTTDDLLVIVDSPASSPETKKITIGNLNTYLNGALTFLTGSGSENPQFATIELGHSTDTTLARVAAGRISVEGTELQKQPTSNGIVTRTAAGTAAARTITGTANLITVTDGDGVSGNPTLTVGSNVVQTTASQTITNKRIQPRTASSTSNANLTPDLATANVYYRTTQNTGLTINAPTGTPVIGEVIAIYVDSAGAQTLTMNATYIPFGAAFPASTTAGKTLMITAQYNGTNWKTLWANAV